MANLKFSVAVVAALWMGAATSDAAERRGIDITAGAGVSNFSQDMNPVTDPGIGYGLRVGFHPWQAIGFELGYQGGLNNFEPADENIVSNHLSADLKLGAQVGPISPYVFGGVGGYMLTAPDAAERAGLDNGVALTFPWGGGVAMDLSRDLTVEGRFQYDTLVNEDRRFGGRDADYWTATLNIGGVMGKREE